MRTALKNTLFGSLLTLGILAAACSSSSDAASPDAACSKAMSLLPEEQRSDEAKAACAKSLSDFKQNDPKMYDCITKCLMKSSSQEAASQCNPTCGYKN